MFISVETHKRIIYNNIVILRWAYDSNDLRAAFDWTSNNSITQQQVKKVSSWLRGRLETDSE